MEPQDEEHLEDWFVEEKKDDDVGMEKLDYNHQNQRLFTPLDDEKIGLGPKKNIKSSTTTKYCEDYILKKKIFGKYEKKNFSRISSMSSSSSSRIKENEESKAKMIGKSIKKSKTKKRIYSLE